MVASSDFVSLTFSALVSSGLMAVMPAFSTAASSMHEPYSAPSFFITGLLSWPAFASSRIWRSAFSVRSSASEKRLQRARSAGMVLVFSQLPQAKR